MCVLCFIMERISQEKEGMIGPSSQSVILQVFHYSTDLKGALLWPFPDLIH